MMSSRDFSSVASTRASRGSLRRGTSSASTRRGQVSSLLRLLLATTCESKPDTLRFSNTVDEGCYYHEAFLRGMPELTCFIRRLPQNVGKSTKYPQGEPGELFKRDSRLAIGAFDRAGSRLRLFILSRFDLIIVSSRLLQDIGTLPCPATEQDGPRWLSVPTGTWRAAWSLTRGGARSR